MHIHKFLATTVVLSFICANVANSINYSSETSQLEYKLLWKGIEEDLKGRSSDDCPVWMYLNENNTCICGTDLRGVVQCSNCLLYTSPSPRDATLSRMPSSA